MARATKPSLVTLGDFFHFAVARFRAARLAYGHGTTNAVDEAAFMVLEALRLPISRIDPWLDLVPTEPEKARLMTLIAARIGLRMPAPYLLEAAYMPHPNNKIRTPTRTKPCNPWPVARARRPHRSPQPASPTNQAVQHPALVMTGAMTAYTPTGTCHPMRRPRQPGQPHTRRRAHITDKIAISKTRQRQPRTTATTAALQRCGMASHNLSSKVSTAGVDRRCVDRWTHRLQSRRWHVLRQRIEYYKRASHTAETKLCQPARAVSSGVHIATGAINVGTGAPPDPVPPPHGHTRGSPPPPRGTPS